MKNVSWDNSYDSYSSVSMVFKPFMYSPLDWTLISETELRRKKFEISFKNHKRMYDFSHVALLVYRKIDIKGLLMSVKDCILYALYVCAYFDIVVGGY